MVLFLGEARNPNKELTTARVKRLLKKFGEMQEDPKPSSWKKSANAHNQLAQQVRARLVRPNEYGSSLDAVAGSLYSKLSNAEIAKSSDQERSRQAREN